MIPDVIVKREEYEFEIVYTALFGAKIQVKLSTRHYELVARVVALENLHK